jgi:hypothetical protein
VSRLLLSETFDTITVHERINTAYGATMFGVGLRVKPTNARKANTMPETVTLHTLDSLTIKSRKIESLPIFPYTVEVGGVSISLKGDGTYEGDKEAFIAAANAMKSYGHDGISVAVVWLVIAAISKS